MCFWCLQFSQKTNLKTQIFVLAYCGRNFSFVFWENWKNQKVLPKITDLYLDPVYVITKNGMANLSHHNPWLSRKNTSDVTTQWSQSLFEVALRIVLPLRFHKMFLTLFDAGFLRYCPWKNVFGLSKCGQKIYKLWVIMARVRY